ncbi:2OG-Fe dioxygenase family protein [Lysobacter sp. LF1]|uniref:2OG-Fe dioxygenase family protein n=1 Tax=Lysobacter stagni TaxID=3045172 RepID=A0ABT6XCN6_9GAMM|nr:2OG-Fe dioxygenase family protein [Lysobacter sp. LF1]MDI9237887.1 2OG-Fe dioxygenase family protein [Lysobacter sp. LF1]
MRSLLEAYGSLADWPAFAASWETLEPDLYLANVGLHRRRRHAVFSAGHAGAITREAHQPHYQSRDYNTLQGGIERWFEPVLPEVADSQTLQTVLGFCQALFGELSPEVGQWQVEVHQFRIEARADEPGQPTPEGVHRDGVDYVLVLMVDRHNIASGTTTIHDAEARTLGSFTLRRPFDAALVDDRRVYHGVTPVQAEDTSAPSHRDVLVVTFRRM